MAVTVRPGQEAATTGAVANVCVLCAGARRKPFLAAKQRTVVECRDCGLRALDPMPSIADLVSINEETVHPFFSACLEDEESYRRYFAHKLDDVQRRVPSGRLLDVGCGAGFFLDAARARGYQVRGLDLSPVPAAYARAELALDVTEGSIYGFDAPAGSFDVITIFQTIEHDPEPLALTRRLYDLLAPGGALMVTTPAADGFVARAMGKRWFGYRNVEHVSFFSRRSLGYVLERAGFEVAFLDVEHGKRLTAKYVLNRLINYYYNHRTFIRTGLRLLHPAVFVLQHVPLFEPWAHLYALARKPPADGAPAYLRDTATEA